MLRCIAGECSKSASGGVACLVISWAGVLSRVLEAMTYVFVALALLFLVGLRYKMAPQCSSSCRRPHQQASWVPFVL